MIRTLTLFALIIVIFVFFNLISNILLPFVIGTIIAYFLDPAADKLEKKGWPRAYATLFILSLFILFIIIFSYSVGPILYKQLIALITQIPQYIQNIIKISAPYLNNIYNKLGYEGNVEQGIILKEFSDYALSLSKNIFKNIWLSSIAIINFFSLIFITPIVTFYLLKDWDVIMAKLSSLIPKRIQEECHSQLKAIDLVLSAYVRGQTNVCLILGIFYAISLSLIGLNFGFLVGFLTGIFTFIPYFGVLIGMLIGTIIAIFQGNGYAFTLIVLGIFLLGQFIEGNFITPKLVGSKIGIHPALIIFSLLTGGALFGFTGILFAIPVIAIIGVLVKFFIKKYLTSKFYLG
jgi:predicted PurR-regulated permease PerM